MDYSSAVSFLKTVSVLSKALPEGVPYETLFESYVTSFPLFESGANEKAVVVFLTKLTKTLGTYALPENASPLLKKFEKAVDAYDVPTVSNIRGIDPPLVREALLVAELALVRYHL